MYRTNQVYGVSNEMIETYIERDDVDRLFIEGLQINKHIIVFGASKQGKTYLTSKHLKINDYIKVDCSPNSTILDIYNSIIRQLNVEILESRETSENVGGEIKFGLRAKIKIPFFGSSEGETHVSSGKERNKQKKYKIVDYNLCLAQDVSELLRGINFSKRIILENFHYLSIDIQQQLAIDLRIFEDYNILFIILGIWRERNRLIQFNGDLLDRVIEIPVEPWRKEHLSKIVETGLPLLNVSFHKVIDRIIASCFDSVGVFQEICKEACYAAGVSCTSDRLVEITDEHVATAIQKKLEDYTSRHMRCLECFVEQTARTSDEIPLYIPYYFVRVLFSTSFDEIHRGIKRKVLQERIQQIHHRPDNVRPSDMGNFVKNLVYNQVKKQISPPIFDYDFSTNSIKIIDSTFYFFLRNCEKNAILDDLNIPIGLEDQMDLLKTAL